MVSKVANTREVFIGPTSYLATSLAEIELFIHELCRFGLPHAKISVNM